VAQDDKSPCSSYNEYFGWKQAVGRWFDLFCSLPYLPQGDPFLIRKFLVVPHAGIIGSVFSSGLLRPI